MNETKSAFERTTLNINSVLRFDFPRLVRSVRTQLKSDADLWFRFYCPWFSNEVIEFIERFFTLGCFATTLTKLQFALLYTILFHSRFLFLFTTKHAEILPAFYAIRHNNFLIASLRPPNGKIDSTKRSIKRAYIDRSYETRCILDPSQNLHHFEFLESCPMTISKYKHRKCIIV